MDIGAYHLKIILILTIGFSLASLLGYLTYKMKLSPILGYLLAGYIIGPYSPGYAADLHLAEQLAEIGVVLMMFGVGIHFRWEDLLKVKNIAIPGAVGQTFLTALFSAILIYALGWSLEAGIVIGLAIGVASTVVLIRVLNDNHLLNSAEGHIAIGWLIVEDILTVIMLILLPSLSEAFETGSFSFYDIGIAIPLALGKFFLLVFLMLTFGKRLVKKILLTITRTHSHELFTLTVLSLVFLIAVGSAFVFGTSIALGAFIAGMIIGQTEVRHQASINSLPMKDAFLVIFFLAIGMLFSPEALLSNYKIFLVVLGMVLLIKPLIALVIVLALKYPWKTALIVALSMAQIGEFSFILCEAALKLHMLTEDALDVIVGAALISISLNPLLFKYLNKIYNFFDTPKALAEKSDRLLERSNQKNKAIIVGYGPVGQKVYQTLSEIHYDITIIERNIEIAAQLVESNRRAIYGDAVHAEVLQSAHLEDANFLIITSPNIDATVDIIETAQKLTLDTMIIARVQHKSDEERLKQLGALYVCGETEIANAFRETILFINAS